VVANELNGCDLALRLLADTLRHRIPAEATALLPPVVNTRYRESAPLLWRDDVLYFTRLDEAGTTFWRSTRRFGAWQQAVEGRGFPITVAARLGSGSFTPDGKAFYCTLCDDLPLNERNTPGLRAQCALYLLRKTEQGWQEPERLRDYINLPDQTVLHPFVLHQAGRELLFFASNREGSLGGLDLYVCQRSLDSDSLDFSLPQNLGPQVNSAGDDVCPFYDLAEQMLWFSSNGHAGIGGLDVYRSQYLGGKWLPAAHAGLPINSPYDDYFFTKKKNGDGVLVSNRPFGSAKPDTHDDDLLEFFPQKMPPPAEEEEQAASASADQPIVLDAHAPPTTAAAAAGSFRICLEVVPDFEAASPRYRGLHPYGQVQAVPMPEQDMQRVLLGPFATRQEAQKWAEQLRRQGAFPHAFVVRN
ncbi:MAG TPA: SPOR domain-containing protein, partial [Saprospiraceae bacterium]|nr:SPOR domain-containing protein [Saprospiraceae bacterium]